MKKLRVAFQMDALEKLNKAYDSTLYIARAGARRGYELFHYEPQHLRMEISGGHTRINASGHGLNFDTDGPKLGKPSVHGLEEFDVILMRQDPPFDLGYIAATHMLEHLRGKVRIVNDPVAVRNAPEKLLNTHFPQFMPPTIITRDIEAIRAFRARHGDVIFKPLYGHAGYGIFHLRHDDNNLHTLLETMGGHNREPWLIQKYLREIAKKGDKRIVLLGGEPVGFYTRIPARGDARGNQRVGAKPERTKFTPRDREVCETLGPLLRERGLFLVGLDMIGDYLTEINVTSPTGLVVADQLAGRKGTNSIAERFWEEISNLD